MGELYGTCALLAAVLFFCSAAKFESRFSKVDKELSEIKENEWTTCSKLRRKFPAP